SDPEAYRAMWQAWQEYDVTELLPQISPPTLVLHNKNNRLTPLAAGQRIAAAIPGARFATFDDPTYAASEEIVNSFLAELVAEPEPAQGPSSGMTAILFAYIADSTGLTERLGDAAFRAKARDLDAALRSVIREHSGTAIEGKLLGDGVLAVFTSARQAIEAALACARSGDDARLPLHLGLQAGEGRPFVTLAPPTAAHVELVWQMFPFLQTLAQKFRVIWLDARGCGLSDRKVPDFSMEAMVRDVEAVVSRMGDVSFVLPAWGQAIPIA